MKSDEIAAYQKEYDRCKKLHTQYLDLGDSYRCLSDPLGKLLKKVASVLSGKRKDHRCNLYGEMLEWKSERADYRLNPYKLIASYFLFAEIIREYGRRMQGRDFVGLKSYQTTLKAISIFGDDAHIQADYCLDSPDLNPRGGYSEFDELLFDPCLTRDEFLELTGCE